MFELRGKYARPKEYYDNAGTKLIPTFSDINNALSGLTVSAAQLNFATSFPASAAYAVSAGTAAAAVTAINAVSALYAISAGTAVNAVSSLYAVSANYAVSASTAANATTALAAANASYAASAGTLSGVSATVGKLNNILYGSAIMKYAIGSTMASDGMILAHGLNTGMFGVVNAQISGIIANCLVSSTGIRFFIQNNSGVNTSATVDWIVYGGG